MGSGIAQKMATEGFDVVLVDVDEARVAKGLGVIDRTLQEAVERNIMRADRSADIRRRIRGTARMSDLAIADLVVEAVFEDRALKQKVFRQLEEVCGADTILATNTSSYLVAEISSAMQHPERALGLHYFFHPAKNHLVEVVASQATDPEVVRRAWSLQERLRKIPIASRDSYGFIVNRFFGVWLVESIRMLEEGVAGIAAIDDIAKETFGVGMGPFELMNVSGVPIALHASTTLGQAFGPMYAPPALLRKQVESGKNWDGGPPEGGHDDPTASETVVASALRRTVADRLLAATFLVASTLVDESVGTKEDTDIGARVGLRWPAGPFEMMNRYGTAKALAAASALAEKWRLPVPSILSDTGRTNAAFAFSLVRSATQNGITTITVNRPDTMNALNETVVDQLQEAFRKAAGDSATRGIVIAGAGRSFVAGADIRFFTRNIEANDIDRIVRFTRVCQDFLAEIDHCAKPVVARLHGLALGGGVELALACDYIVTTPGTSLGFPETGIGIYPGLGGTQRTTRRVGVGLAKWLVLTGQIVSGEEALAIGLVDRVAPHEDLDATVAELVALGPAGVRRPASPPPSYLPIAQFFETHSVDSLRRGEAPTGDERLAKAVKAVSGKAPIALRLASSLIERGASLTVEEGLRMELAHLTEIFGTKDALTGLLSVGKSRPVFEGR
jgi:enoyl-CoA hydratase/3-hydroxyacyl-CoA dehydrogenase